MPTYIFGACAYMIVYSSVLYYQIAIGNRDIRWFRIYIPFSVIAFVIMAVLKSISLSIQ